MLKYLILERLIPAVATSMYLLGCHRRQAVKTDGTYAALAIRASSRRHHCVI